MSHWRLYGPLVTSISARKHKQVDYAQGLETPAQLGKGSLMVAGGIGGAAYWIAAYPQDVIKSSLQTQRFESPLYHGIVDCARKVYAAEGLAGFARGLSPCMLRAFPSNAASFVIYESFMDMVSAPEFERNWHTLFSTPQTLPS
jgi:hypothetical protein